MAEFEVEGKTYDTESFSKFQKDLIHSLSITKDLTKEIHLKKEFFSSEKKKVDKTWMNEFGSKIKDTSDKDTDVQITLSNGRVLSYSKLDEKEATCFRSLLFLNDRIIEYSNQLQVLDTARITYSKTFYQTIKGAE